MEMIRLGETWIMSWEITVVCEMVIVLLRMAAHMRTSSTHTHIPMDPTSVLLPVAGGRKRPTDFDMTRRQF